MDITSPEHASILCTKNKNKKSRYGPGDWVFARRPGGSLLIAARDVPYAWRLFRGATEATAYAAPRLRFAPACRAKSSAGSDGGREGLSSVRSRAARIRDFEGPDSAIVGEARKERPCRFGVNCRVLSIQTRPWRGFPTPPLSKSYQLPSLARADTIKTFYISHLTSM